jgi:hypothetical protein
MADFTVTPKNVSPLPGFIARQSIAGGSGNVGDTAYIAADGDVEQGNAGSAGTAQSVGIIVGVGTDGALAFVAGDALSIVVYGPVAGFSGLTPGALGYQSDTAGKLGSTAGTTSKKMGRCESATVFFVQPVI